MATNDQQPPVSSSSEEVRPQGIIRRLPRWIKWAILILVLIVLIGAAIWWYIAQMASNNQSSDTDTTKTTQLEASTVCTNDIIHTASTQIADNDITGLETTTQQIKSQKNYRGDVNCDYILTRYYIMTGGIDNAQSALSDLKQTYGNAGGYSTEFNPPAIAIKSLEDSINTLTEQRKETMKQTQESNAIGQN